MNIEQKLLLADYRSYRKEDVMVNFYDKKKRGVWLNPHEQSAFSGICPLGIENLVDCLGLETNDSYHSPCSVINSCCSRNCEKCLKYIVIEDSIGPMLYLITVLKYIPVELIDNNDAKSFVYWIGDGEYVKIGKANSITKRIKALQTGQARNLRVERVFGCKTERDAHTLERYFHRELKRFNVRNEWFNLPIIDFSNRHSGKLGDSDGDAARLGLVFGEFVDDDGEAPAIGF